TCACWAASPSLACEEIFARKDLRTKGRQITKINNMATRFYSIKAHDDKKLLKEIKAAVEKDKKLASNIVEKYNGNKDQEEIILDISNSGRVAQIGVKWRDSGYVDLFINIVQ
ncbi:MAG: hypothetical protein K2K97_10890, partial [Muribaculaceae bacterium]|nr:hypothetical protein [Muribaculaceae bacterium]